MAIIKGVDLVYTAGIQPSADAVPLQMQKLHLRPGETLNATASEHSSEEFSGGKDSLGSRTGVQSAEGNMGFEFRTDGSDIWLEALFGKKVDATDPGTPGTIITEYTRSTPKLLTIERQYKINDIQVYNNLMVNQLAFTFDPDALVTCSVDLIGSKSLDATSPIDALPDSNVGLNFNGIDCKNMKINGVSAKLLNATLTITNDAENQAFLGSEYKEAPQDGKGSVDGTFDCYFENRNLYTLYKNNTEFEISFELTFKNTTYTFLMPKCVLNGARDTTGSVMTGLVENRTFKALRDETIGGAIKVIKKQIT